MIRFASHRFVATSAPVAVVMIVAALASTLPTIASEPGQTAAAMVTVESYRHFLDDELYTHDGDNRYWGPEHNLARDNIAAIFQSFGLSVELHPFTYASQTYYNVVATHTGTTYPDGQFVVGAHYDSYNSPGADDDASGVAGLLEIARVLSRFPSNYTIKYLAFDREEQWMKGSYAYVNDHLGDDVLGMIQLDMIAWDSGDQSCYLEGRTQSNLLMSALADALVGYSQDLTVVVGGPSYSDHTPFEDAGFAACLLIEDTEDTIWSGLGNPCYHQPCDSVDNPGYIAYAHATDMVRGVTGFLVDHAGVAVPPCGDGVVSPGETCDTAIPAGQPGACPTTCDSGDPCIIDLLLDPGTCQARCQTTVIAMPIDDDGCCPAGANAVSDNDCEPVCGNDVCEIGETITCVPDCQCDVDADCNDHYVCTADQCAAGTCLYDPAIYGDVDANGVITLLDLFCVLDGFGGDFSECTFAADDIHGSCGAGQPNCCPNGVINLLDLFAVLDAFQGEDPCCGG